MSRSQVLVLLAMLAEQSGDSVSESRVDFVGRSLLETAPPEKIIIALNRLLRSSRRFPTVGEVEEAMGTAMPTAKDQALLIADTIIQAAIRFGWCEPGYGDGMEARRLAVGPTSWEVINRQGGWNNILDRLGENQMALRAQLRDVAESYFRTGVITEADVPRVPLSPYRAFEKVRSSKPLELPAVRGLEAKEKLIAEVKELRVKRQLALLQSEKDEPE